MADIVESLRSLSRYEHADLSVGDEAADEIERLRAEIERLRGGLSNLVEAVDALIAESEGVYGLHRNGDPAPWEELTEGGQFEGWLLALEEARAALDGEKQELVISSEGRGTKS